MTGQKRAISPKTLRFCTRMSSLQPAKRPRTRLSSENPLTTWMPWTFSEKPKTMRSMRSRFSS